MENDTFECKRCGYISYRKSNMKQHFLRKKQCKPTKSDISIDELYEELFEDNIKNHYIKQANNKITKTDSNVCMFCKKVFARPNTARKHMRKSCLMNPLLNNSENIEFDTNEDGKTVINVNNIQNIDNRSIEINNTLNIGQLLIYKVALNETKVVDISDQSIFLKYNDIDVESSEWKNLFMKSIQNTINNVPKIDHIAEKIHFGNNHKFYNIRMVRQYNDKPIYKVANSTDYAKEQPWNGISLEVDDEYIDEFEKMFTQILTNDGWKNVDIKNVANLLIGFIIKKMENLLQNKVDNIQNSTQKQNYENKLRNLETTACIIRLFIDYSNRVGRRLTKSILYSYSRVPIRDEHNKDMYTDDGKLIFDKEKTHHVFLNRLKYLNPFNEIVDNIINTIKTKSEEIHGDYGEKLIILNNVPLTSDITFDSLVDGVYYKKLYDNGIIET